MQAGRLIYVRTDAATQFRTALAQHAALTLNLAMPAVGNQPVNALGDGVLDGGLGAGGVVGARLKSLTIVSVQNLAWEVWLWAKDTFNTDATPLNDLAPLGRWAFAAADGLQIAAAGAYYYYIDGLDTPYSDFDKTGELHVMLVNRSAGAAKSADDAGALFLQFGFDPTLGW